VVIAVALVAAGLWVWLGDPWYVMADDLHVHGVSTLDLRSDILLMVDMHGWHRFRIHPGKAEEEVRKAFPQLKGFEIDCRLFPASCDFYVNERRPILVWVAGVSSYWVDGEGVIFPAQGPRADLPVVRGPMPEADRPEALLPILQGVAALLELGLPADDLMYSPQKGLIWTDDAGRRVAFGVGPDMKPRWEMYRSLCAHLETRAITPSVIDARFPGGLTYAMERLW
jgi:hypothetical protein